MGRYGDNLRKRMKGKETLHSSVELVAAPALVLSEQEFMRQRQMFCIIDEQVFVASPGDTRYHREWMESVSGNRIDDFNFKRIPRGYYLKPNLVWYRGFFNPVGFRTIQTYLEKIKNDLQLPDDTVVWDGAREKDDIWVGQTQVGTLSKLGTLGPIELVSHNWKWIRFFLINLQLKMRIAFLNDGVKTNLAQVQIFMVCKMRTVGFIMETIVFLCISNMRPMP